MKKSLIATIVLSAAAWAPAAYADKGSSCHFHGAKAATESVVRGCADQRKQARVTAGKLIGAACWFDIVDNPTVGLRQGKAIVRYNYSPVPPLEDLTLRQRITDQYLANFASAVNS